MISVIVPCYNSENTIVNLMESVLKSTCSKYELIIVDDASTDNTTQKVKPYLKNKKVRLISLETNSGPAKARNVGAIHAKYNILFFIDSDVEILPNALEVIEKSYRKRPHMSAMLGICNVDPINKGYFPRYRALLEYSWHIGKHWLKTNYFTPRIGTVKKDVLLKLEGFNEKYHGPEVEDYEFGYRLNEQHDIYVNTKLQVRHIFPSYKVNARNYFNRGILWTGLFLKRWKFDKIGTSASAGLETILEVLTLFLLIGAFFFPIMLIPLFISFIIIIYLLKDFLILTLKKEGRLFMLWAFVTRYSLSFVVGLSFAIGVLQYVQNYPKLERAYLLLKSFLNKKQPSYLIFFVTSLCNARCKMCFNWRNIEESKKRRMLTLEEIRKITRNFNSLYHVTFSGGEPVLREDIAEIARLFYENSSTRSMTLTTNGLQTDKIYHTVEKILNECPNVLLRVPLSIDGLFEKHDKIRGVKGNFQALLKTYAKLKDIQKRHKNLVIIATTVLSKFNKGYIKDVLKYVDEKMDVNQHVLLLARGDTREKTAKDVSINEYMSLFKYIDELNPKKHKRKYHFSSFYNIENKIEKYLILETLKRKEQVIPCLAGKRLIILSDIGEVEPCEILGPFCMEKGLSFDPVMGNMRNYDYNINKILATKKARNIINFIEKKKCYCTFECAMAISIFFNPKIILKYLKKI